MGGFMGDIAKPLLMTTGIGAIPQVNKALRPATSAERTAMKHAELRKTAEAERQRLAEEARLREAEKNYRLPSNVRQRALYAASQVDEAGRRKPSEFLGAS